MASASRTFTRALRSSASPFKPSTTTARATRFAVPQTTVRQSFKRGYASEGQQSSKEGSSSGSSSSPLIWGGALLALSGGAYALYTRNPELFGAEKKPTGPFVPKFEDYQKVYNAIAHELAEHDEYEDGSYGPVILRLAWHASGTYDALTGTGGSNGATMRFAPEGDHGANAGLKTARDFLEPVKEKFPWITYSDLWILAGVCAIQEMQGPKVPYRPGRQDRDVSYCTPDGRLPDASKEQSHIRAIFGRMGFNDREMVALSGAHALGRCHTDRSGYDGPWTFSPTTLTNDYYKLLIEEKWAWKKWNGPKQYEDVKTKSLMMLPTDMALIKDKGFRPWVEKYAADNDAFFKDFSDVVCRLFELGVPFTQGEDQRWVFKSSFD